MVTLVDFGQRRGNGRAFTSLEDALWSRVIPGAGGCLIHDHGPSSDGYGRVSFGGQRKKAHRVAWELAHGEIPPGLELDHRPTCDKRCVNVRHLTLLTRSAHQTLTMTRPEERPKHMHEYVEKCLVKGCSSKPYGRGMCSTHYQRVARRGWESPTSRTRKEV